MIKLISALFKKNKKQHDIYAYMGSVGVSPKYMMMYQESVDKIKAFEELTHNKS